MFQQLRLFDDLLWKTQPEKNEQIFFRDSRVEVQRRPYQRSLNVLIRPNGNLKVTVGKTVPTKTIQRFLLKNRDWIEKNLEHFEKIRTRYPAKNYVNGEKFLLRGQVFTLEIHRGDLGKATLVEEDKKFVVYAPKDTDVRALVRKHYEKEGKKILTESVNRHAGIMQLHPKKLKFRSAKSQWGSCSTAGVVSLNWRLAVFPEELCNYVVVHELAHLQHPNHSSRFWNLVEQYIPNYKTCRRYLSDHHYEVDFLGKKSDLYEE